MKLKNRQKLTAMKQLRLRKKLQLRLLKKKHLLKSQRPEEKKLRKLSKF